MAEVTERERWEHLACEGPGWPTRARRLEAHLIDAESVCDLGAGNQILRRFLPPRSAYFPIDCVDVLSGTTIVDLNQPFESLPQADAYVSLGLLEYLTDHARFVTDLRRCACAGVRWYWSYMIGEHGGQDPVFSTIERLRDHFAALIRVDVDLGVDSGHAIFGGLL